MGCVVYVCVHVDVGMHYNIVDVVAVVVGLLHKVYVY